MPPQMLLKDLLQEDQEEPFFHLIKRSRPRRFGVFGYVLKRLKSRSRGKSQVEENGVGDAGENAVMMVEMENGVFDDKDFGISMSSSIPFKFALEGSGDGVDCRSPCYGSPTSSPSRREFQETTCCERENTVKFQTEVEEKEEIDQNSPVSVLDPPHDEHEQEADDDDDEDRDHEEENGYDYNHQCGYAFVQRSKKKSLHKRNRFKVLAELNPFELEKGTLVPFEPKESVVADMFLRLEYLGVQKPGIKRLISHLIFEEEEVQRRIKHSDNGIDTVVKRVCKRLETWHNVNPSTSEMMSSTELTGEPGDWWKPSEEITQAALEIEAEILCKLVEEMVEDHI